MSWSVVLVPLVTRQRPGKAGGGMGTPPVGHSALQDLENIHVNPYQQDMSDLEHIRLNPPPTRKWVKFQDWDEEALQFQSRERRHSSHDLSFLSSSVSSESSLGSTGEGRKSFSAVSNMSASQEEKDFAFNSSFGGYMQNGDAAALRSLFQPLSRKSSVLRRIPTDSSISSADSILSTSPVRIKFTSFDEVRSSETIRSGETSLEERSRYEAFNEVRRDGVYLGWSNDVLGTTLGWSEDIKVGYIEYYAQFDLYCCSLALL